MVTGTIITWIIMGAAAALGGILMKLGFKKVTGVENEIVALKHQVDTLDPNVPTPPDNGPRSA